MSTPESNAASPEHPRPHVGGVQVACLLLLLLTTARLFALNVEALERVRRTSERNVLIPRIGSLWGIGADGQPAFPAFTGGGNLVMFVIRAGQAETDIAYWNEVMTHAAAATAPFEYWGVCDAGAACHPGEGAARFRMIGFLDPYSMRALANAHARDEVLVYGRLQDLKGRIERAPAPSTMAERIRSGVK